MNVVNAELLQFHRSGVKFVLNETGVLFFPATQQHRDMKLPGVSYEEDHRGNAVAGLMMPGRVEIRYHSGFSEERIRGLWRRLLADPALAGSDCGRLYYQGRELV
jgi:hypothetical protein